MNAEEKIQIKRISLLVSCAAALQIAESFIPHFIPGIRLGLANMITLVALVNLGFRAAVEIAVLRTVISSFILGTFLSPGFILSFSGALTSTLIMGLLYKFSLQNQKVYFSLIGISLIGAAVHNTTQLSLVYFLLIRHRGIFVFLPWLGISAVITGWITGAVAIRVCKKLDAMSERKHKKKAEDTSLISTAELQEFSSQKPDAAFAGNESGRGLHLLSPSVKMISVFILAVTVLFLNDFFSYSLILLFLLSAAYISRVSIMQLFTGIRKLSMFIFFSFALPVFFNRSGEILADFGPLKITQEGMLTGSIFAFRIVLLILSASLLMKTTIPDEIADGFKKILSPLKALGISGERIGAIVKSSLISVPVFQKKIRYFILNQKLNGKKPMKKLISSLTGIIAALYHQIDEDENKK